MAAAVRILLFFLLIMIIISLSLYPVSMSIIPDNQAQALLKFRSSLSKNNNNNNGAALDSSWNENSSPCDPKTSWDGVMCLNGVVTGLHLSQMGLSGTIDIDALHELPGLRSISLVNNSFSGPIPQFNRLGALKAIYLSRNQFSGDIPSDFFITMGSLKKLWLSGNKFSGQIPDSIRLIPHLIELHLEYNEFSGPIPSIGQSSITSLDMSHNKLEGEIPATLSRFNTPSFDGNSGLCGNQVRKECQQQQQQPQPEADEMPNKAQQQQDYSKTGWVVLGLMIVLVLLTVIIRSNRKEDRFDILEKENLDEMVEVRVASSNRRRRRRSMEGSSYRKGNDSSRRRRGGGGGSHHGESMGNLVVVNDVRGVFGLPDLMKAAAEVLGNGGLGSAYKAVMSNGVSVVVKRMREMNKLSRDVFDLEIRRLGRLRHPNILTPLAYHYRKEEKLLVSEHVSRGSLLYILHGDRGISHAELNWPTRLKIIKGVGRGLAFLHSEFASYELPHGNLKSSNILLNSSYEPLLSDYALYPLMNNTQAVQAMFAYKSPEAILYQQVSPKSDVYCLGIAILEIITGKFPSQYLNNQKGGTDVVQWVRSAVCDKRETELIDPEIASSAAAANSIGQMEKLLHIGAACTESNPEQRIDIKEAISRIEEIQV